MQMAQRVPLHERKPQRRQRLAQRAVVTVLKPFHGKGNVRALMLHGPEVYQVAYLRNLR